MGPQVEYAYPYSLMENEELCSRLPFMALPDGSHLVRIQSNTVGGRLLLFSYALCIAVPKHAVWHFVQPPDPIR